MTDGMMIISSNDHDDENDVSNNHYDIDAFGFITLFTSAAWMDGLMGGWVDGWSHFWQGTSNQNSVAFTTNNG